ncbi:MAG TPA: LysR substrate-binding domain-containing protein [Geminicoccaceae bacterium]|nr:LysR substrate-binding domain-containing protein [Geminicoccus sp.]HMU50661.1 LysR substrate-binding domain-containing protein [Geminicoccaceae bacterium]
MKRLVPSLTSLQAFEAAARHLNFTRAAEDLDLTQSGMSRQIRTLENFLGINLFERNGPRLVLTEIGEIYAKDIAFLLDKLEEVSVDAVRGRRAHTGLLIGAAPTLGATWLAPRLVGFVDRYPEAIVEVILAPDAIDFEESIADLAVVRSAGPISGARTYNLFEEEIVVVASPKLISRGTQLRPIDFARFRLLQNASRPRFWLQWLNAMQIEYSGFIQGPRFADSGMAIKAAISGLGIAVAPKIFIEEEIARGVLHTPFGPPTASGEDYVLVYPERKSNKGLVRPFRDWILRETRHMRHRKASSQGSAGA